MAKDLFGNCTKCGANNWYTYGNYSRCRPCHSETQKKYYERKKIGMEADKKLPKRKTLAEIIVERSPIAAVRNRNKRRCPAGHLYDEANTTVVRGKKGFAARKCRKCDKTRKRIRYGVYSPEKTMQEILREELDTGQDEK